MYWEFLQWPKCLSFSFFIPNIYLSATEHQFSISWNVSTDSKILSHCPSSCSLLFHHYNQPNKVFRELYVLFCIWLPVLRCPFCPVRPRLASKLPEETETRTKLLHFPSNARYVSYDFTFFNISTKPPTLEKGKKPLYIVIFFKAHLFTWENAIGNKKFTWHILLMLRYDQKMLKSIAMEMEVEGLRLKMKDFNIDLTFPYLSPTAVLQI